MTNSPSACPVAGALESADRMTAWFMYLWVALVCQGVTSSPPLSFTPPPPNTRTHTNPPTHPITPTIPPHRYAGARLAAQRSQAGWLGEVTGGLSYLEFIRTLNKRVEDDWQGVQVRVWSSGAGKEGGRANLLGGYVVRQLFSHITLPRCLLFCSLTLFLLNYPLTA